MAEIETLKTDEKTENISDKKYENVVKKITDGFYFLDFTYDYDIDELLNQGVSNIGKLLAHINTRYGKKKSKVKYKPGRFACTTFNCVTRSGDTLFARNFDYKSSPCFLVRTSPKNGYQSVSMLHGNTMLYGNKYASLNSDKNADRLLLAPYVCMDGMNEKGLCIAVLEINAKSTRQRRGKKEITTTTIIRAVLDKCATVEEAVELFSKYDICDSLLYNYHYQIVDQSGKSVVIEYVNNEMRVIYPESVFQYAMNFFLSEDGDNSNPMGYDRRDKVEEALKLTSGCMDEDLAMKLLKSCTLNYRYKNIFWRIITVWSCVYNPSKKNLQICVNMDYKNAYRYDLLTNEFTYEELTLQ